VITLSFFEAQNLLLVILVMLSICRSPFNCSIRKVEGNFTYKVNNRYCCQFQARNLRSYLKELDG